MKIDEFLTRTHHAPTGYLAGIIRRSDADDAAEQISNLIDILISELLQQQSIDHNRTLADQIDRIADRLRSDATAGLPGRNDAAAEALEGYAIHLRNVSEKLVKAL